MKWNGALSQVSALLVGLITIGCMASVSPERETVTTRTTTSIPRSHQNESVKPAPPAEPPLRIPEHVLAEVQSQGPGRLLQRIPIRPFRARGEFIGFQIVDLFPGEGHTVRGVRVGDVILRINGRRMDRPEQLMKLFQKMERWTALEVEVYRNGEELIFRYEVTPISPKSNRRTQPLR